MLKTLLPYLWLPGSILLGMLFSLGICLLLFGNSPLLPLQVLIASSLLSVFALLGFVGAQISRARSFNKEIEERIFRKPNSPRISF